VDARDSREAVAGVIALVQLATAPTPHVVRVLAPFLDGSSAEQWAIEHGYQHYLLAPLILIR
jgi:hypothetical protein